MIIEKQANGTEVAHKISIECPHCERDVNEGELHNQKCTSCGSDLTIPKQSVSISAAPIWAVGGIF